MAGQGDDRLRAAVTIFGFNTDIRHGDTVFHVQTEAHASEQTLESAIFVRGRCIGRHSVCYARQAATPDFDEHYIHELVTQQHRTVVNTIKAGRVDQLFETEKSGVAAGDTSMPAQVAGTAPTEAEVAVATPEPESPTPGRNSGENKAANTSLNLELMADKTVVADDVLSLRFRVTAAGTAEEARIVARLDCTGCSPLYAQAVVVAGEAAITFKLHDGVPQAGSRDCIVVAKASAAGKSVARKFRLRRF